MYETETDKQDNILHYVQRYPDNYTLISTILIKRYKILVIQKRWIIKPVNIDSMIFSASNTGYDMNTNENLGSVRQAMNNDLRVQFY